ncbi:hypothetical protein [Muricoccus radiodurans]|uniref:hypothetical protein n=1 Tax=Muricoccus radiodurans TaxID=2231721 RepID=UPI003CEA0524
MTRRPLAVAFTLAAGLCLSAPVSAAGTDGVFGDFLSRAAGTPAARPERTGNNAQADLRAREQESRNLRRDYWQRERERLTRQASNGDTVLATR